MLKIILILSLLPIIWEDFKYREISIWFLSFFILSSIVSSFMVNEMNEMLFNLALTSTFFVIILVVNTLIQSVKANKFVNIIDKDIGLGDVVFWIGLAFQFYFAQMILFFIITSIIILVVFLKREKTIPLAGIQACFLIILLIIEEFYEIGRFENLLQI